MMLFIIWYVVPMALSLLAALLYWKSERFANWWIGGKKESFPVIFWGSFIPIVNLAYIAMLSAHITGYVFKGAWRHTFGKVEFNYPPHLK